MKSDWLNSALSPVVYGDIALSINTQYNTFFIILSQYETIRLKCTIILILFSFTVLATRNAKLVFYLGCLCRKPTSNPSIKIILRTQALKNINNLQTIYMLYKTQLVTVVFQ